MINKKKVDALCIVAHPDDETIWMGGTIMKNKNWNWTIVSLCRKADAERATKFFEVCRKYGAAPLIADLDDEILQPLPVEQVAKKIEQVVPKKRFAKIFTHGKNGEYGHMRHIEIHKAIKLLLQTGELKCDEICFFSYLPGRIVSPHDSGMKIPTADNKAKLVFKLSEREYKKKFGLITDIYGFKHPVFETLSCGKTEAFSLS